MAGIIKMKKGEGKWVKFLINRRGSSLDVSSANISFGVKKNPKDTDYLIFVNDAAMDKTEASLGIVLINIPASKTSVMDSGEYQCELKIILVNDKDVDKSNTYTLKIEEAIIHT